MFRSIRDRLSYANVTATMAVFLALGGGAYAAIDLVGRNDIKSKHIKNGQVKDKDLAGPTYWAVVDEEADLARAGQRNTTTSVPDDPGTFAVDFNRTISDCAYVAALGLPGGESVADPGSVTVVRASGTDDSVYVATFDETGSIEPRGFHLAVNC